MADNRPRELGLSTSFCPLRWSYLQVDLQHGRTKACCKTPFQALTRQAIAAQGAEAIFNSEYVQARRAEMLTGIRHSDCTACWKAEDLGVQSYRQSQAAKPMFQAVTEAVTAAPRLDAAVPKHIEIISRTTCDLACSYCGPDFSVRWEKEIERHGQYPEDGKVPVMPTACAPPGFAEIFRDWLTEHVDDIDYIQFNGGCFRTRRVPWGACLIRLSSADARNLFSGLCMGAVRGRWPAGAGVAARFRRAGLRAGRLPVS